MLYKIKGSMSHYAPPTSLGRLVSEYNGLKKIEQGSSMQAI